MISKQGEEKEFRNEIKNVPIRKAYYNLAETVNDQLGFSKTHFFIPKFIEYTLYCCYYYVKMGRFLAMYCFNL